MGVCFTTFFVKMHFSRPFRKYFRNWVLFKVFLKALKLQKSTCAQLNLFSKYSFVIELIQFFSPSIELSQTLLDNCIQNLVILSLFSSLNCKCQKSQILTTFKIKILSLDFIKNHFLLIIYHLQVLISYSKLPIDIFKLVNIFD